MTDPAHRLALCLALAGGTAFAYEEPPLPLPDPPPAREVIARAPLVRLPPQAGPDTWRQPEDIPILALPGDHRVEIRVAVASPTLDLLSRIAQSRGGRCRLELLASVVSGDVFSHHLRLHGLVAKIQSRHAMTCSPAPDTSLHEKAALLDTIQALENRKRRLLRFWAGTDTIQ